MSNADVTFEIEFGDGVYVALTPTMLDHLPRVVEDEIGNLLKRVAERMAWMLRDKYQTLIRERPRDEGESLRDQVLQAIVTGFQRRVGTVEVGVFDLGGVERKTRTAGHGDRSLFEIMEEGYESSGPYCFVSLEAAQHLAQDCADQLHLSDKRREELLNYVNEKFRGRHGEGIMTNCFTWLFVGYPEFGTPFEHGFLPHPGWEGWNVLSEADGPLAAQAVGTGMKGGMNWMDALLAQAFANAGKRLKAMGA